MSKENRREQRAVADKSFFIGCRELQGDNTGFNVAVRLMDVSSRGACFVSKSRLRTGLRLQVLIVRPGAATRVSVDATVCWSTTLESKGQIAHVSGIKFDRPVNALDAGPIRASTKPAPAARAVDPRRRSKRVQPKDVRIVCLTRGWARKLGFRTNHASGVRDMSLTGVQISSRRKFEPGDRVDLEIALAGEREPIQTEGVVRWCRRDTLSLEPRWNIGCAFQKLDPASKTNLQTVQLVFAK